MRNKKEKVLLIIVWSLVLISLIIYNPFLSLKLKGDEEITVVIGNQYTDAGVEASYFGQDLQAEVVVDGNIDVQNVNEYKLEYILTKGLTRRTVSRTVKVVDKLSPEITLKGEKEYTLCGREFVEPGFTAIDDYDGDITDNVEVIKASDKITYKVKDRSGNETIVTRKLNSKDNIKPTISLKGSEILTIKKNGSYEEYGAIANDNCDGEISSNIKIEKNIDTTKVGDYPVTYIATDASNNETRITRIVKVFEESDMNKGYDEIVKGPTYIKSILIVNKKYSIPSSFGGVNSDATNALKKMQADALSLGYNIPLRSGYRSYNTQKAIYENYVKTRGLTYADQRSARAGHSEHQTGLAFDIGQVSQAFGNTAAGKWLATNCHKYGFIIRYPKGKELITGYSYEPWHVRYVGVNVATEIMEKSLTLEEYLGIF